MKVVAKKSLGQNFLVNNGVLDRIVASAGVGEQDAVIEIGPGTGNLTKRLAATGAQIIAIEKDTRLITPLKEMFAGSPNVEIIEADVLKLKVESLKLKVESYKIVANIPYYITSHFLKMVFEFWPAPELIVLTIQKEVAERICAKPPRTSILALSVQYYAEPEIIMTVSRGSFRPVPNVDSAIIKLTARNAQPTTQEAEQFFRLVRAGFSHKRKKLLSNLADGLGIQKTELEEIFKALSLELNIRPEELTLKQWLELASRKDLSP